MKQFCMAMLMALFLISCGGEPKEKVSEEGKEEVKDSIESTTPISDTDKSDSVGVKQAIRESNVFRSGPEPQGYPLPDLGSDIIFMKCIYPIDTIKHIDKSDTLKSMIWDKLLEVQLPLSIANYQCWLFGFYINPVDTPIMAGVTRMMPNANDTLVQNFIWTPIAQDSILVTYIVALPPEVCQEPNYYTIQYVYGDGKLKKSTKKLKQTGVPIDDE